MRFSHQRLKHMPSAQKIGSISTLNTDGREKRISQIPNGEGIKTMNFKAKNPWRNMILNP